MKKFMKRLTVLFMATFMLISCVMSGCNTGNPPDNNGGNNDNGNIVYTLSLNTQQKGIELMEEFYLNAEYVEVPDTVVTYRSENESIATVEPDGKVKGQGIGTTNIVATYGTATAKCEVSVSILSEKPSIVLDGFYDFTQTLYLQDNQPFDLNAKISYKGKIYDDAEVEYSISEDAGLVEGNRLTPNVLTTEETKDAKLTIKATWRNASEVQAPTLTETINVKIVKVASNANSYLLINNTLAYPNGYTLYKEDMVDGQSFLKTVPLVLRGIQDGVELDNTSNLKIEYSNPGIVNIENDKMTATEVGKTNVTISFADELVNPIDGVVSVTIPVEVIFPVVDMDKKFTVGNISKKDNYDMTAMQEFFNTLGVENTSDDTIQQVIVNYNEQGTTPAEDIYSLTINGNTLTGFKDYQFGYKDVDLVFMTETYGYRFDARIYTDIITTKQEFIDAIELRQIAEEDAFLKKGSSIYMPYQATGSYLLTIDVNITDVWQQQFNGNYHNNRNAETGFFGYIDGQGHHVTFDKLGSGGVFGIFGDGSTLKNIDINIKDFDFSVEANGTKFSVKSANNNNRLTLLGAQAGTGSVISGVTYLDGTSAKNYREIRPMRMDNVSIRFTPTSTVDGLDGLFAHVYSKDAIFNNIFIQINENVNLECSYEMDLRDDNWTLIGTRPDDYGILCNIDAGNVGAIETHLAKIFSNTVIVSHYKEIMRVNTIDARNKVLVNGKEENPPRQDFKFYVVGESHLLEQEQWYIDYMASLYVDKSDRLDHERFTIKNIKRYDSIQKLVEANANRVGNWLINADGTASFQA